MPVRENLFRKSALDRLSSPEQLDVMMQVTSPMGWIALVGVGLILVFATVWSVVGRIGIRVDGQGILIRGGEINDVTSGAAGRVTAVLVKPGDQIAVGQLVATVDQPELQVQIANMQNRIRQAEEQKSAARTSGLSLLAQYRAQQAELREKVAAEQKLVNLGLVTKVTLLRTKQELAQVEQAIAATEETQSGKANQVEDLKGQLQELEARQKTSTDVKSAYKGRVLEVVAVPGGQVSPGSRILTLEPLDVPIQLVVYIPAGDGKKVRAGMPVRVSPSTVKVEEYGYVLGVVRSVADFPVTPEGLRRVLRNDRLADQWLGRGASIEVVVNLSLDPSTPSGYAWSSSKGPPTQVFSGTIATASVVVEERVPISYVLPIARRAIGVS